MKTVKLLITGMACQGCADSIGRLFDQEPGIKKATVSYEHSGADVEFDPDQLTAERLVKIVEGAGFGTR